jgi:hypothetical protein
MAARNRRVHCDKCDKVGGSYGPTASAEGLRSLRRGLAEHRHWEVDTGDLCPDCQDPPVRQWSTRDDGTLTTLTADTYPYGAGVPDHGIQITLRRDEHHHLNGDPYQCLRLPHSRAVELARWILDTYGETR